jgi:Sulfotransferase family
MATIEILSIERFPLDSVRLWGAFIDRPIPATSGAVYTFDCAGWVLGRESPALAIELLANDGPVRRLAITLPRPDVSERYPRAPQTKAVGFWERVSVIGMTAEFELVVQAVLENQARIPIGRIRGRHVPVPSRFEPRIQPLLVTSMGRTGTTWTMRLLAEHPAIVAYRVYPYEMKAGRYWMHLLSALMEPATQAQSQTQFAKLDMIRWWVAEHPFPQASQGCDSRLQEWIGRRFVDQVAAVCQRTIEDCYREVAITQGQAAPAYFAEKHLPDEVPGIIWELYPKAREIFLVRDFRDMLCSVRAFNAKRRNLGFGRHLAASEREYIFNVGREAQRLLNSWKNRSARACLVRYEDLVLRPMETLVTVLKYLGLESTTSRIHEMVTKASLVTPELREHRTTVDTRTSVGRWRTDLDSPSQLLCEEVFGSLMKEFGYCGDEHLADVAR